MDAGVISLALGYEMTVRYLISKEPRFAGGKPITKTVAADVGWTVDDLQRNIYLMSNQGNLQLTSRYQPFTLTRFGPWKT